MDNGEYVHGWPVRFLMFCIYIPVAMLWLVAAVAAWLPTQIAQAAWIIAKLAVTESDRRKGQTMVVKEKAE